MTVDKSDQSDALALLTADHAKVKQLFKAFKELQEDGSSDEKTVLVAQICNELRAHAEIEEVIFYPAVRKAIDDDDLMDEALVEHASAKDLIALLEGMSPGDDLYDARVTVLGEQIQHHVKEEEGEMFTKAKRAKVDTQALGVRMAERKAELLAPTPADEEDVPRKHPPLNRTGSSAKARPSR